METFNGNKWLHVERQFLNLTFGSKDIDKKKRKVYIISKRTICIERSLKYSLTNFMKYDIIKRVCI